MMECSSFEEGYDKSYQISSIDECADACYGKAELFAFGTNDFGSDHCDNNGCYCLCETASGYDATCDQVDHVGYRLFKYKDLGFEFHVSFLLTEYISNALFFILPLS